MVRRDNIEEITNDYGFVIVDECHRVQRKTEYEHSSSANKCCSYEALVVRVR